MGMVMAACPDPEGMKILIKACTKNIICTLIAFGKSTTAFVMAYSMVSMIALR